MIIPPTLTAEKINCFLVDVIKTTLAICDYRHCDEKCSDYIMAVSTECPVVFHNEQYTLLWNTLFRICSEMDEQSHMMYLDK